MDVFFSTFNSKEMLNVTPVHSRFVWCHRHTPATPMSERRQQNEAGWWRGRARRARDFQAAFEVQHVEIFCLFHSSTDWIFGKKKSYCIDCKSLNRIVSYRIVSYRIVSYRIVWFQMSQISSLNRIGTMESDTYRSVVRTYRYTSVRVDIVLFASK